MGYYCLDGSGSTWTKGSDEPLFFTFKRTVDDDTTLEHFTGLAIDGAAVAEKDAFGNANYTATSGSAIIALQPAYVEALSTGEHTLTISFDDGEAQATFTVAKQSEPSPKPDPDNPTPDPDDKQQTPSQSVDNAATSSSAATKPLSSNAAKTGDPLAALPAIAVTLAVASACCLVFVGYARRRRE